MGWSDLIFSLSFHNQIVINHYNQIQQRMGRTSSKSRYFKIYASMTNWILSFATNFLHYIKLLQSLLHAYDICNKLTIVMISVTFVLLYHLFSSLFAGGLFYKLLASAAMLP